VIRELRQQRQRADPRETPPDDAEVERGDAEAGERAGDALAPARQHAREHCRPYE
jgi:hypothetical protein